MKTSFFYRMSGRKRRLILDNTPRYCWGKTWLHLPRKKSGQKTFFFGLIRSKYNEPFPNDNMTVDRKKMSVIGSISVIFFVTISDIPARTFFNNINIRPMNGTFFQKLFFFSGKLSSDSTSSLRDFFNISSDSIMWVFRFFNNKKYKAKATDSVRFSLSTKLKRYKESRKHWISGEIGQLQRLNKRPKLTET